MKPLILALCLVLWGTTTKADDPPPVPNGGITFTYQATCTDIATSEKGMCYVGHDIEGNYYVTFWQDDQLMKISKVVGDEVEVVWMDDHFASY